MIQEHPKDIFGKLGERVEFSIKTNPIATSYQWYFNRIPISPNDQQYEGSATDTLIIKECLLECEVGFFYCEVTDKFGGKHTSKIAKLIIDMFQEHPKDILDKPGERVKFSVKTDSVVSSYKWYFKGTPISSDDQQFEGSATDTLIIKKCQLMYVGYFYCEVTKFGGKYISKVARLKIDMFQEHPKDIFAKPGERVEFSVKTEPTASSYKWYFEETSISSDDQQFEGSAADTLIIKKCQLEYEGYFYCEVTDEFGGKYTSKDAKLEIDMFLEHPQDTVSKPGERVELSVKPNLIPTSYQWYFDGKRNFCVDDDERCEVSTLECLIIRECQLEHGGKYHCTVTDESGRRHSSKKAMLSIGELIEKEEAKLLGEILYKTNFYNEFGDIDDAEQLTQTITGEKMTYELFQYILKQDSATRFLSQDLKNKLKSRLKEEKLYKEAIADDYSVSLSYVKILALGPGQVGKSTFLYRLMGLMEGNIQTADPETQPQSSTGITEQREACIQYTSHTGALTSTKKWQVFEQSSELETQLGGLMSLISEQIQQSQIDQENLPEKTIPAAGHNSPDSLTPKSDDSNVKKTELTSNQPDVDQPQTVDDNIDATEVSMQEPDIVELNVPGYQPSIPKPKSVLCQSEIDINVIIREFEAVQYESRGNKAQIKLDMLLNIADIGGQPAFLEMIPSLTIGPALYLVFMNLLKGLETRYPVVFKCKGDQRQVLCKNYTYTSEEVIFTALSSIASFGNSDEEVEMYILEEDSQQKTNSLALLVGTFADKVSDSDVTALHTQIKNQVQETDHYTKKNLLYDTKFLEVNNFSGKDDELQEQRLLVENVLRTRFKKYQIPARWLILSICLKLIAKKLGTFEVSFSKCVEIGSRFGMTGETIKVALKFLHKYIGLVMYFPNHPNLKDVVICDPQIVFSSVSELIFDIYDPSKKYVPEAKYDHFVKTGCFSPQDILPIDKKNSSKVKNLLSIKTIVELLVHLNIAAEVPSSSDDISPQPADSSSSPIRKEYFLPAVLQTADTRLLRMGCVGENDELVPEPLCIRFVTGYVPLGFVCALSANLIANNELLQLIPFEVNNQSITYKNMMKFRYNGEVDIIMLSGHKYCEFHIKRWSKTSKIEFWDTNCCPLIKTEISEATNRVVQSMQHGDSVYKLTDCFELAFKCPEHKNAEVGHEPLARLIYEETTAKVPNKIQCVSSKCVTRSTLTPAMKMWFGKDIPAAPLKIISQPSLDDNVIRIKAEGTKPIKYQWSKDGVALTDDNNYKGSATPELFIRSLDPQVPGMYSCKLEDKHGHCALSEEIRFDPFAIELKHRGLKDREIHALIDVNGFQSLDDLKMFSVDDVKELDGLKPGERVKVKRLLMDLQQHQDDTNSGSALKLNYLKDVFWEVRAKWYLLGIQLDVEHSSLEVARRKTEVYDKYIAVLKSFLERKSPPPCWDDVKLALESDLIGHHDFDLPREVQEQIEQVSSDSSPDSDDEPSKATRLRKVLTALWEVRAQWRRLAGEIDQISEGDCEAISANHSSVEDCFATLIHKCLTVHKDSVHQVLLKALRSRTVGRDDIADEFETK